MRSILFSTILVLACAGAFLAACDHEEARSTAPESASWNAAFRVDAGSLTARQLESATWVRVEASRDGAVLAAKEAAFDVGSVTLRIPSPGDVDISLTGYRDQTKALVMWRGAGVVKDGLASPALNVVAISAGTGLSYDNTLSSLSVTSGTLVRELPSTATTYFDTVGNSVARVTLSGKTTDPLGTVEYSVDGGDFGTTDSFPLAEGTTTVVTVKSTNLSGSSRTCTVSVYRKPAPTRSKPRYLLSTSATNGTISLNPTGGTYDSGASVTATATPDDGYVFSGWSGACTNASGTCTVAMTGAKNLTANFAAATVAYDSTLSAFTLNGTTVKGFASGIAGAGTRTFDDTVSFASTTAVLGATATESGSTVSDTGSVALGPTDPTVKTVTVTNANGNTLVYTIRIHHRPLPRYALAISSTNGTISLNPTGGTYDSGASVTATATPEDGYVFNGWSGACGEASATCTVSMTGAKSLTANFKSDFGIPWNGSITYGTFRDSRDQRTYRTVVIGGATWMAENLNYSGSGVCYGSSEDSCSKYGRLYTWAEVMKGSSASAAIPSGVKGICPEGWHVPSDAEWQSLEIALGMSTEHAAAKIWRGTTEGTKLKSTGGWNNSGNGTDDYGFRVLPAGTITRGEPAFSGDVGIFWSASDDGSRYGWHRAFQSTFTEVFRDIYPKAEGLSLRCLRD